MVFMKRMYIILGLILVVMLGTFGAISQIVTQDDSSPTTREPFDRQKRRMELREEMHKRMRDKILHGLGPDQDLFKDMDAAFEDAFTDIAPQVSNFKSEWSETTQSRVLTLTPQSKDQKLNIDVNATAITIKGESEQKTATSSFMSSFTNSFPIPDDCDGTKVKMKHEDGKILVELPFKNVKTVSRPPKIERRPIQPAPGAVEEI